MRKQGPTRIGEVIPALLERLGLSRGIAEHSVLDRWAEIVGPQIAGVTVAERIRAGRLWVRVNHPAWRNELVFMKAELIGKINAAMGAETVRDIIFR